MDDFLNGDVAVLSPVIDEVVVRARREGVNKVGHIVYELSNVGTIIGDEVSKVREAAEARLI